MSEKEIITIFAKTNFRNREVPFGIKTDDRRRHMYLIGKTGMGKTTLMENMAVQDIRNGFGVCFLDQLGDSVQRILNSVPANRVNDIIYFNPADLDFPIAFNILEAVDSRYKHLVASGLMGVFTKIWANVWSARMEYILNNTILALLDSPGNTLLGITRMYVDKKYRKRIIDNIKDPVVKTFWLDEYANYNDKYKNEAIAPIQNKVGQFLSSAIIRNIVGQPKSTIDMREIMDDKKILIVDISKGRVGEDNAALLGAMVITKLQLAALSRANIHESDRSDFYLYVDEFQNFATDSFATILSEARKYRLNLIVGHQYIAQLEQDRNTKVRDAIFGNVGTMIIFRVGATDAEFMETEFDPIFTPNDLVNLPKYQIILKLMINGVASDPFSAITLPPNPDFVTDNMDKIVKVSRERYTNPINEVEEKISRWMGAEYHKEAAILIGQYTDDELEEENESVAKNTIEQISPPKPMTLPHTIAQKDITPNDQTESAINTNAGQEKTRDTFHFQEQQKKPPFSPSINQPPIQKLENFAVRNSGKMPEKTKKFNKSFIPQKKQNSKKENPVWKTVENLHKEKTKQLTEDLNNKFKVINQENVSNANYAPPKTQDFNAPRHTVINPGESHTFKL